MLLDCLQVAFLGTDMVEFVVMLSASLLSFSLYSILYRVVFIFDLKGLELDYRK